MAVLYNLVLHEYKFLSLHFCLNPNLPLNPRHMDIFDGLRERVLYSEWQTVKGRVIFKSLPLVYIFFLTTITDVCGGDVGNTNPSLPDFVRDI